METLTNVCLDPFVSYVHSSAVSADGYPLTNLISTIPQIRARGFRVEHFIRPPLSIEFRFKYPVDVAGILLKPGLDTNSETRIIADGSFTQTPISAVSNYEYNLHSGVVAKGADVVIHLKNRSYDRKWANKIVISSDSVTMVKGSYMKPDFNGSVVEQPLKQTNIASKLRHLKLTVTRLTGVKPFHLKWIEVWGSISLTSSQSERLSFQSALLQLQETPDLASQQISFFTPSTSHQSQASCTDMCMQPTLSKERKLNVEASDTGSLNPTSMKPPQYQNMSRKRGTTYQTSYWSSSTKRQRMEERCSTEVSLKPLTLLSHKSSSRSCAQQTLEPNLSCVNSDTQPAINESLSITCGKPNLSNVVEIDSPRIENNVPSKFLDAITYDVMLIPMLLPSGHFVDRSTVNKLAINDTLYGRPPTDPFTGVAFNDSNKPEFCPELKVDIDRYLTTVELSTMKESSKKKFIVGERTVGTASDIARHMRITQKELPSSPLIERSHPASCSASSSTDLMGDPLQADRQYNEPAQGGYEGISPTSSTSECTKTTDRKFDHASGTQRDGNCAFESKISCSLDEALNQLFSS